MEKLVWNYVRSSGNAFLAQNATLQYPHMFHFEEEVDKEKTSREFVF